jgi:hypothetical protein
MLVLSQLACNLPSPDIAQRSLGYCLGSLTGIEVRHNDALHAPLSQTQEGRVLSRRFSSFLPVLYRAVIPERSVEDLIHRWVLPKRFFPQLNAEARALGDNQIAMLKPKWLLQELALGRFRLARIFLQGKVGDTGIELDAGGGADR